MSVHAGGHQDLGDGHAGGAGAGDDDPQVVHLLADDLQRVLQRGQRDDRGAVLVVVEDGDVEALPQPLLDLEAGRGGDVLEVDAAEDGGDALDGLDDGSTLSWAGSSCDVSRQIGKASTPANSLNSSALPSITGRAASGPMSPRPSTAVPSVTMATVFRLIVSSWTSAGLGGDGHADPGHAGRVGHRQVVAVDDRHSGEHLDLAAVRASRRCGPPQSSSSTPSRRDQRLAQDLDVGGVGAVDDDVLVEHRALGLEALEAHDVGRRPHRWPWPGGRGSRGRCRSRTRRRTEYAAVGVDTAQRRYRSALVRRGITSTIAGPHRSVCGTAPASRAQPAHGSTGVRLRSVTTAAGSVFAHAAVEGFEQVAFCHHEPTGLKAIIALHSTVLGPGSAAPASGPTPPRPRRWPTCCRLARGMTYKHAVSGLDAGGGKAVIIGDPRTLRSEAPDPGLRPLHRRARRPLPHGRGRGHDPGRHGPHPHARRPYVTGASESLGGSGDPSPATAWGVRCALDAVAERLWGDGRPGRPARRGQRGRQGRRRPGRPPGRGRRPGHRGRRRRAGRARRSWLATPASTWSSPRRPTPWSATCSARAPSAAVLSEATIPELACAAVCGSANNQLATAADGQRLADRGVLYAPDYVANAGGVINIAEERHPSGAPYDRDAGLGRVAGIADTLRRTFDRAEADGITPAEAADRLAEERIEAVAGREADPHVVHPRSSPAPARPQETPLARTMHAPTGDDLSTLHIHDRHTELGLTTDDLLGMYRHDPPGPAPRPEDLVAQPHGQGPVRGVEPGPRGLPGRLDVGPARAATTSSCPTTATPA